MARSKKASEAIQEEVKLELTPMIDVTFLILIFFMCTLKFKTLEGKLVSFLPTDKGLAPKPEELKSEDVEIILRVPPEEWTKENALDRRVQFLRNGSNQPFGTLVRLSVDPENPKNVGFVLDPPNTFELISNHLKTVKTNAPDAKAKINAYARTAHIHVVTILNLLIEAGFDEISYSGIPNTLLQDLQSGKVF